MASSLQSHSPLLLLFLVSVFIQTTISYPIEELCKESLDKKWCADLLQPYRDASLQDIGQVVIDKTSETAAGTSAKIQTLLSQESDPNVKAVYSLCSNYYSAASSALSAGKEKLKARQYRDVNTAANIVMEDAASCDQAFSFAPGKFIPLGDDNKNLNRHAELLQAIALILSGSY